MPGFLEMESSRPAGEAGAERSDRAFGEVVANSQCGFAQGGSAFDRRIESALEKYRFADHYIEDTDI